MALSGQSWKYHVYLSFRGQDTRTSFVSHLYAALRSRGISVFKDDTELEMGEVIAPRLFQAIEDSLFSIVVFSKNYASSTWLLDELTKIVEAKEELGRRVFPIFYFVDPSDVRRQKGPFLGEAFAQHERRFIDRQDKVQRWRQALTHVANLSGWESRGRDEANIIEEIVESIWSKLLSSSHDEDLLVGIQERMSELNSHLGIGLNDVRFVGIWGMGGIGKTTLAKAVYNMLSSQFEISCFLADIREVSKKGIASLQKKLISHLKISSSMKIVDREEGTKILRLLFRNKKVLLVLDDVNHRSQLENLAAAPGWFGEGSRVIITTRDMHILRSHGVHEICTVDLLTEDESRLLLCLKAFRAENPPQDYVGLCESVVKYAECLPLALQVLGYFLSGRSTSEWEHALENTVQFTHKDILETIKRSYDELGEEEKAIFLDVACFFNGWEKDRVIQLVKKFGLHPTIEIGLTLLVEKSLIIEVGNCLKMHGLLQEMGRRVVVEEFPKGVWQLKDRSEVWSPEDIAQLLQKYVGSNRGLGKHGIYEIEMLKQVKQLKWLLVVWRIVGFVSSIVGVVSYGRSMSFKHIFGEWTLLKMCIYCTLSLLMCGMTLVPKVCQLVNGFLLKPDVVFVAMMVSSLYSYFYDKFMSGKPDTLSLISSGAFCLVSLSLSRQSEMGFEVGVTSFLVAFFMLLLMKINFTLTLVAGVVAYIFIRIRSCSDSKSESEFQFDIEAQHN